MLKVAIINNNIKTLKYLLEMNKPTKNENDLLYYACFLSNVEAVRVLCNYNCLDENEFDELFPVHLMCLSKNLEIAKLILKKNIDVNKVDKNGFTGPHYMINAGSDVFIGIMMLLLSNGFDVNNINAVSVLSECCLCYPCDSKKIIWLVNNGFSTDEKLKINNDEMTILQFLEKSNPEVYTKIVHENDSKHDIWKQTLNDL